LTGFNINNIVEGRVLFINKPSDSKPNWNRLSGIQVMLPINL